LSRESRGDTMSPPSLPVVGPSTPAHSRRHSIIRRLLFGVPAALITLALILPAGPAAAGARKVILGVTIEEHNRDRATFQKFERQVGNTPRIWTLWSQWGNRNGQSDCVPGQGTCSFPTDAATWVAAEGAVPMIFWEPVRHGALNPCEFSDHRRIANGAHDDYIRAWARAAKAYNRTVLVRFAHEINGAYFPWGLKNTPGTPSALCNDTASDYKAGWRRIVGIFRSVGATKVKFVWTVAKSTCKGGCNPYDDFYPGNSFVHYVGFSNFNWGAYSGKWVPMVSGVSEVMVKFRQFTRKPVIVAENATNTFGGDKPGWIRAGYEAVYRRWPQIRAIVYLNVNLAGVGHPDWSLNTPGWSSSVGRSASHKAYESIADKRKFRGRIG
jgi:Glycosyl hydrolase family 26